MYAASDLRGLNAMVGAPATPDANRLDATDTVDVDSLRDLLNKLIADGVNAVSMMGSYGECHTLLWEEFQTLTKTAVETVDKRVPLFIGVTSGAVEETLYRGYAIERLSAICGSRWFGAALATIAFGLAHVPYWGIRFSLAADLPFGILMTLLYLWRRDLAANAIAHAGALVVGLLSLPRAAA